MSRGIETGQLSPLGTVRRRLEGPAAGDYPFELLAGLRDADLGPESLFLAWELAGLAADLPPAERRSLTGLLVRALIQVAGGSTRAPVTSADRGLLARAGAVVGAKGARCPFILDGAFLYPQRLLACEDRLAAALRARRAGDPLAGASQVDQALAAVADGTGGPALTDQQLAAVRAALAGRLTVISGGPGTGKTTIALTIVRGLARLGIPAGAVALAAPTGKAANRLEEAMQLGLARLPAPAAPADAELARATPPAQTLHRLLGWSPSRGTFAHHHNNRLAHRAVIIDESSMVDLTLMERLVRSVADDARLVLLGDADQLPSIEAGAVFRDLTPLAHRLEQSHRVDAATGAGRDLAAFARAIRDGAPPALAPTSAAALRFQGVEAVPAGEREAVLERWYESVLAPDAGDAAASARRAYRVGGDGRFSASDEAELDRLNARLHRARILCVTRGRPTGTWATNQWLHRRHGGAAAPFAPGEPVMALRNDYQRGLYNGDQGVVIRLDEGEARPARLAAAFRLRLPSGLGWQAFPLEGIGEGLELSFAMTVHKAQGSELDLAALVLPDAPLPILTRELLYTAVTRVRQAVVVCGEPAVLAAGAAAPLVRSSGLADALAR